MEKVEPKIDLNYSCEECGEAFMRKCNFEKHRRLHTCRKPTCDRCGKEFSSKLYHQIHVENNTCMKQQLKIDQDDGLICEYCRKVFLKKSYLTIHRRSHTGEKPYTCGYCGRQFSYSHSLKRHMNNVCVKQKPQIDQDDGLICEYCGKVFRYKSNLTIHRRSHTGEKPYTCDYCSRKFGYSDALKSHLRKNVCIKQKPQIAEQQVQDQPLDLSKPRLNPRSTVGCLETSSNRRSLEGRHIGVKEHPQEADNIQPTAIISRSVHKIVSSTK